MGDVMDSTVMGLFTVAKDAKFKTREIKYQYGMCTFLAIYVHFNCCIQITINFHTNPYNLALRRLL